jgi:hypothetical protein
LPERLIRKAFIDAQIEKIRMLVQNRDEAALREKFKQLVPTYHPSEPRDLMGVEEESLP